jgi:iron complex transport system substrate-binding protein
MRIVSLLPSATEIVYRLGHGGELVGRSQECDYPPEVRHIPVVMRARTLDSTHPSGEIDARVKAARARGESLYALDVPLLRALRPELLLTQDLCGVCSVTGDEVRAACRAAGIEPRILSLVPRSLEDVRADIRAVAQALRDPQAGDSLDRELRARQAAVVGRPPARGGTVAVVEWLDPPILAGLWVPEMVELAGGRPEGTVRRREPGVRTRWEELARARPDLTVVSPCSFPVERTLEELRNDDLRRGLGSLVGSPIWIADEAYFSRPGPRLWDGLELLADLLDGIPPRGPLPVERWGSTPRALGVTA